MAKPGLRANATLVFSDYVVMDDKLGLTFTCPDPGPGQNSDYTIVLTDTELNTVSSATDFRNLVLAKFQRKLRAANIASKLDPLIGQSITLA